MLDKLLQDLETTAKDKGLNFGYGYTKDYSEKEKQYPLIWILPLNASVELSDGAPDLNYTVTGFVFVSAGKKQLSLVEKKSDFLFVDFLKTFDKAYEDYLLSSASFEHVPERLTDAAFGVSFSFNAAYQPSLPCV